MEEGAQAPGAVEGRGRPGSGASSREPAAVGRRSTEPADGVASSAEVPVVPREEVAAAEQGGGKRKRTTDVGEPAPAPRKNKTKGPADGKQPEGTGKPGRLQTLAAGAGDGDDDGADDDVAFAAKPKPKSDEERREKKKVAAARTGAAAATWHEGRCR